MGGEREREMERDGGRENRCKTICFPCVSDVQRGMWLKNHLFYYCFCDMGGTLASKSIIILSKTKFFIFFIINKNKVHVFLAKQVNFALV